MYRVLLFLISIYGSIRGMQFPSKGDLPRQYHPRYLMYEEPYNIEFKYHNYEQMSRFLRATSLRFQNLTALYSIGKSVKGTDSLMCKRMRCEYIMCLEIKHLYIGIVSILIKRENNTSWKKYFKTYILCFMILFMFKIKKRKRNIL